VALLDLSRIVAFDPHRNRRRRRNVTRLRAVRPAFRVELHYRAELYLLVGWSIAVGEAIAARAKIHWPEPPQAHDAKRPTNVPGSESQLAERAYLAARRLTDVASHKSVVRRNLAEVDKRLAKTVRVSLGVDIGPLLSRETGGKIAVAMEHAAAANVALIESIPQQHLQLVREAIVKGYSDGQRWEEVAKRVEEIAGITKRRARFIAQDQTAKLTSAFNRVRQTSVGIKKYEWSTSRDERVRPTHAALNGTVQRWDSPPDVGGEHLHPGEDYRCRCAAIPVFVFDEAAEPAEAPVQERQAA
jgi:SPP1 gp7 family putative phage head morphogenesis protein